MDVEDMHLNECNCKAAIEYPEFLNAFLSRRKSEELHQVINIMKEAGKAADIIEEHLKNCK